MSRSLPPLNSLKAFDAAAECESFTLAAQRLCVTQSAVSRQVKLLEEQLGVRLFQRGAGHLRLTDVGRRLQPVLRQSFDRIAWTVRGLQEPDAVPHLRLNAPPTFASRWLTPRLGRLKSLHPDLELTLTTRGDSFWDRRVVGCRGSATDAGESYRRLRASAQASACAGPQSPGAVACTVGRRSLPYLESLVVGGRYRGVKTSGGLAFDLLELAIHAAVNAVGVTIADRHMVERELEKGELVPRLDVEVMGHCSYWLATRPDQTESASLKLFRHWLAQEIEDPPTGL